MRRRGEPPEEAGYDDPDREAPGAGLHVGPREQGAVLLRTHGAGVLLRAKGEGRLLRTIEVHRTVWLPIADHPRAEAPRAGRDAESVWEEFHDRMRAFVARRVGSAADAEDIVQKVFLRIHRTVATLRDRDRLDAWLYQIARNAVVDHYRSPSRRREVPSGDAL